MDNDTWEPDPIIPAFLNKVMDEADAGHFDEGEAPVEEEAVEDDEEGFDGDVGTDVLGLMNLGKLTKRFDIMGHSFVLKTLTIGEELAIGQVVNEFAGTIGQGKAFQTAVIASAIVTVDGREIVGALGADTQASLQDKFDYITRNWYIQTIDKVWLVYQELLVRQQAAYNAILSKSTASRTTS